MHCLTSMYCASSAPILVVGHPSSLSTGTFTTPMLHQCLYYNNLGGGTPIFIVYLLCIVLLVHPLHCALYPLRCLPSMYCTKSTPILVGGHSLHCLPSIYCFFIVYCTSSVLVYFYYTNLGGGTPIFIVYLLSIVHRLLPA